MDNEQTPIVPDAGTETQAPETPATPVVPDAAELAQQVAALTARLAELDAKAAAADAAAEAARRDALSEAERLAEDRRNLEAEKSQLVEQARESTLDRLRVIPKARQLAPAGDPRTPEGLAALEQFARDNPEFVLKDDQKPHNPAAPEGSRLSRILSGVERHPFMSRESFAALLGGK